jgi:hypothetical protein
MSHDILLAGVPHAGKTTFLALLHLAIAQNRYTSIALNSWQDDREYLNGLASRLLQCEDAVRTEVGRADQLDLSVSLPNGAVTHLKIPDLSGETWLGALKERRWTFGLRDTVRQASGACVFVNVDDFLEDPAIAQAARADAAAGVEVTLGDETFRHRADVQSAQVQLVDLLQILGMTREARPFRVSLILSAYDRVDHLTPIKWIEVSAPLVHQYLSSNADWLEVEVFGASAQGGSFATEDSRNDLLEQDPLDRAFVCGGDGAMRNFDDPILWAMAVV